MSQETLPIDVVDAYALTPISTRPRNIRLLHVHAALHHADQQDEQTIRGSLVEADLDARPHYVALSYVWGEQSLKPKALVIDDNIFNVTENCYAALWHLRHLLGPFSIWIDAICINQDDEVEKVAQISLMDVIFRQAEQVYAWLGPNDSFVASSVHLLENPAFRTQFNANLAISSRRSSRMATWTAALDLYFGRLRFHESEWARWSKRESLM